MKHYLEFYKILLYEQSCIYTFLIVASKVPGSSVARASSNNKSAIPVVTLFLPLTGCTTTLFSGMLLLISSLSLSLLSSLFLFYQCHYLL